MKVLNINDYVWVKLTDYGRELARQNHELLFANAKNPPEYRPVEEDADGKSKWQLWHLMQEFGPYIHMGNEPPFETEIEIPNIHLTEGE